jgi:release factor glutamine methyltransferase
VLVPRPETEQLVEAVLNYKNSLGTVLDVGCGSGCIGITLKLEAPEAGVTLSDVSPAALKVAHQNSKTLGADVQFIKSDLLNSVHGKFDTIVANLPYVAHSWQVSPATQYEPKLALYADDDGTALIKKLILQAPDCLNLDGILALEMDTRQVESITDFAVKSGHFTVLQKALFFAILQIK